MTVTNATLAKQIANLNTELKIAEDNNARLTKEVASLEIEVAQLVHDFTQEKSKVEAFLAQYSQPPVPPVIVPPVNDDPNAPELFVPPIGDFNDPSFVKRFIARGIQVAYHRVADDRDYNYWAPMMPGLNARGVEINVPNYAWLRLIGWQAGGADKALFGPYR